MRSAIAVVAAIGVFAPAVRAQCPDGSAPPCARGTAPRAPANSIAVLSFQSRSRDTNDIFLAEGLADDIAARLGQVERLVVRSREAVRRLPNADALSMPELGRRLNAAYILSGSVQPVGSRLRATIELTRAQTSDVAWSSPYDRVRDDILTVQAEIATAVAGAVAGRLGVADNRRLAAAPTTNAEAFAHIVRGTAFLTRRIHPNAVADLREAVRDDPRSALAWARLGQAWALCASGGCRVDADTVMYREARAAADRALALDSGLADAWLADGLALINAARSDLPAARRSVARAVRLDPSSAESHHVLGFQDLRLGDYSAATRSYREALAVDPGRGVTYDHLARVAFAEGRFRDEEALADTALAIGYPAAQFHRSEAILFQGDRARIRGLAGSEGWTDSTATLYLEAFARLAGADTAGAGSMIDRLRAAGHRGSRVAVLLARCGRRDEAASVLRTWTEPGISDWFALRSPAFGSLRGIPEFDAYLERARARALWTGDTRR